MEPTIGTIIGVSVGVFVFVLMVALVPLFVMCYAAAKTDKLRRKNRIGVIARPPPYSEVARPTSPPPAYRPPTRGRAGAEIFTIHAPPDYRWTPLPGEMPQVL
ncbi:uncharacterized protein LOC135502179 [Lineus longissimus]|uniref:uncharacterized protein LOC135502179 n=1 Tax=Lineus longissimus TaxID=88925 RepID=UPI002B4E66B1